MLSALSGKAPPRRDVALALALAIFVFALARHHAGGAVEALGPAALCVPLAWRTRWPLAVLAAVACGGVLYLSVAHATNNFISPLIVALYTATVAGSRSRTIAIVCAALVYGIVIVLFFSPDPSST